MLHNTTTVLLLLVSAVLLLATPSSSSSSGELTVGAESDRFPVVAAFDGPSAYGSTSYFGRAVAGVGDLNGDSIDDFAFAAPYARATAAAQDLNSSSLNGAVFVLWGKKTTPFTTAASSSASWSQDISALPKASLGLVIVPGATTSTDNTDEAFKHGKIGLEITGNCDVNHDGHPDLIIGATGAVYVVFGHAASAVWSATLSLSDLTGANGFVVLPSLNETFMTNLWTFTFGHRTPRCAGDFNNDGIEDIIFGDYLADHYRGRAVLVFGRLQWPAVVYASDFLAANNSSTTPQGLIFTSSLASASLGATVGSLDLNLDGHVDLVFGAHRVNGGRGMVHVFWGGQQQLPDFSSDISLPVSSVSQGCYFTAVPSSVAPYQPLFGFRVATAGDINGDSHNDLVISAPALSNGRVTVIFAVNSTTVWSLNQSSIPNSITFTDTIPYQGFGRSLATGDLNADGIDDILIGSYFANQWTGSVYIWFGQSGSSPQSLTVTDSSVPDGLVWSRISGVEKNGALGYSVGVVHGIAGTADVVVVGAFNSNKGAGSAFLLSASTCVTKTTTGGVCVQCIVGYGLNAASHDCDQCQQGSMFSTGLTACKPCSSGPGGLNCQTCLANSGKCVQCSGSDYRVSNTTGKCVTEWEVTLNLPTGQTEVNTTLIIQEISQALNVTTTDVQITVTYTDQNTVVLVVVLPQTTVPVSTLVPSATNNSSSTSKWLRYIVDIHKLNDVQPLSTATQLSFVTPLIILISLFCSLF